MLKQLFCIVLIVSSVSVSAQKSHGGEPSSIDIPVSSIKLNGEACMRTLKDAPAYDNGPLRFAYPVFVNYSPANSGEWFDMGDGILVWKLALKSEGARSLSVKFDKFKLFEGARVFIYNTDRSSVIGSFTCENNKSFGSLSTSPVAGDEIIIELQTPKANADIQQLVVGEVYHDFLGVMPYLKSYRFGYSDDCHVDVSCDASIPEEIRRSVCRITVSGQLCSGTLVNNTANDGKPYFLTANHCVGNQTDAQDAVLYFNFEVPACTDSIAGTDQQQISGADFKAGVKDMDFSLIRLSETPPASYRPYWAGWDRAVQFYNPVYCVHHPQGDVKKVSWSVNAPVSTTFNEFGFIADCHWQVEEWASGTTEGGSSGSGLFSSDNKLIGSLSGGYGTCENPHNDYYSRLNMAWDFHADHSMQLSAWLDPLGTGAGSVAGFDYYNGHVKRVRFANDEMSPVLMYSNDFNGPWSGTNARGYDAFAQYIYDYGSVKIHGIYIIPAICDDLSSQSINVKIWNSIGGVPTSVVYDSLDIRLNRLKRREYLVEIADPVEINGEFFIGIELNNPTGDTVALYNSRKLNGSYQVNRAFIRDNGSWKPFNQVHPSGENGAFWIDFLASDIEMATDIDTLKQTTVSILPNLCKDGYINYVTTLEHLTRVEMYSINGELVTIYQRKGQKEDRLVIPNAVQSGVYLLVFKNSVQSVTRKIMVL